VPEKPQKKILQKKNKALEKDLSSVHQARVSRVESEQLLQTLTNKSIAGIYVVQGGRFRYLNSNAASYAGYRVKELVGTKANMIVHPDDREMVNKNARAMLKGEYISPHEFRILTKAGHVRWILELVAPIFYEGKPAILGNSMDITKRKIAEEQLRESEQRLTDIIDFLPDATFAIDLSGKVIAWNRAIEDMTGVKAEDMVGKGNYEHAIPFYGTRRPILIDLVFKNDKKIQKKYFFIRKEGNVLLAEADVPIKGEKSVLWGKAKPLYNSKGDIIGAIESIRDITERQRAKEALRESERRLADIINFLPDATLAIDLSGKVIAWNRAIENMTGVKAEDMVGKGNYEYAIPFYKKRRPLLIDLMLKQDKKVAQRYTVFAKEGDMIFAEVDISNLKGKRAYLWGKASPLFDNRGNIVGAIESIRDITDRKQVEENLKYREQELEANNIQLQDLNAALRVLLKQREQDKNDLEEKVLANIKKLIMPYLDKLKKESRCVKTAAYLSTLESNLKDIIAPFAHRISSKYVGLTNREVQVAGLIKEGRITKEIAEMLNISESAINIHRYNIRRKLELTKKHNLHAYLSSLA
jgi:PAS domain S-box-containing protein